MKRSADKHSTIHKTNIKSSETIYLKNILFVSEIFSYTFASLNHYKQHNSKTNSYASSKFQPPLLNRIAASIIIFSPV